MAKDKGYKYFAIRNGGECLSGKNLYSGYKEHGESDECFDGEGGHDAMNVYNITGNIQGINGIIIHSNWYFPIFVIGSVEFCRFDPKSFWSIIKVDSIHIESRFDSTNLGTDH